MDDLIAFLTARLDEDEETARATSRPAWRNWYAEPWYDAEFLEDGRTVRADLHGAMGAGGFTSRGALPTVMADHITRHDPARVLREVEAKRVILAAHKPYVSSPDPEDPEDDAGLLVYDLCAVCVTDKDGYAENWPMDPWPCLPLRAIAAVWSDHPDYRPEWKPRPAGQNR